MYIGFDLKINNFFSQEDQDYYFNIGDRLFKQNSNKIEKSFNELILENGNIDGKKMESNWFPEVEADIFLSHSHKNEEIAIALAGYLNQKFDITVFIDSCIWGHSNDLLKKLDKDYSLMDNGFYDYNKRNFTTSNVHMLLSTALTKMMAKTECLFFLNTPESISLKEGVKSTTLSPWIYSEIETSKLIKRETLSKYRIRQKTECFSKGNKRLNESIEYPVNLEHLTKLNIHDLRKWESEYYNEEYALDVLYFLKGKDLIFL